MANTTKCKDCVRFDQKFKFVNGKRLPLWYGWCSAQSTYPATMPPGHELPAGVAQVEAGETHSAVIVGATETVPNCLMVMKKG